MATIQYSGLVSGIQGKINGSVLSSARSGKVFYNKPSQKEFASKNQLQVRSGFASNAKNWNMLTPSQRMDWDTISANNPTTNKFGELYVLTGYQYYQKMSLLLNPAGVSDLIVPDLTDAPAYQFSTQTPSLEYSIVDQGYLLESLICPLTIESSSTFANKLNIYLSLPLQDFGRPYFNTYYFVGQLEVPPNLPAEFEGYPTFEDVIMPPGWYTFPDAMHYILGQFFIPAMGTYSVKQIWNVNAEKTPDIIFPTFRVDDVGSGNDYLKTGVSSATWDIYWKWVTPPVDYSIFEVLYQYAPAQMGTAPPLDGAYASLIVSGLKAASAGPLMIPSNSVPPNGIADLYIADFGQPPIDGPGAWIPVRAKLRLIGTSTESEWTLGFFPIDAI